MGLFKTIESAGEVATVANPIVGGVIAVVGKVLDNLFPDPALRAQAALELERLQDGKEARELAALLQAQMGQIDTNKIEAASDDPFKSRWRPFLGWVCGVSLGYSWLVAPFLSWASMNFGWHSPPTLSVAEQMTVVGQMLGLAATRTQEKLKGVA
jgi:hypothetical protein